MLTLCDGMDGNCNYNRTISISDDNNDNAIMTPFFSDNIYFCCPSCLLFAHCSLIKSCGKINSHNN